MKSVQPTTPLGSQKLVIQKMMARHLDDVLKIESRIFTDPWSRKSFQYEILANAYSLPLVLLMGETVIGYSIIWMIFEEFHIANFAIHPDYQGRGLGAYFFNEIMKKAVGVEYAILEVRDTNLKAIRLYEKFGFKKIVLRKHYYSNGDNAIVMRKWLNPAHQAIRDADSFSKQKSKI